MFKPKQSNLDLVGHLSDPSGIVTDECLSPVTPTSAFKRPQDPELRAVQKIVSRVVFEKRSSHNLSPLPAAAPQPSEQPALPSLTQKTVF